MPRERIRLSTGAALAVFCLLAGTALTALPPDGGAADEPLSPELLEARTVVILDTTMKFAIFSKFVAELKDWGRFEVVYSPDEADLCMALSTRPDFTVVAHERGESRDEDDPLEGRAPGTVMIMDKLYLKIFPPGGDDLWRDDADLEDESKAPSDLVDKLRERMEAESGES